MGKDSRSNSKEGGKSSKKDKKSKKDRKRSISSDEEKKKKELKKLKEKERSRSRSRDAEKKKKKQQKERERSKDKERDRDRDRGSREVKDSKDTKDKEQKSKGIDKNDKNQNKPQADKQKYKPIRQDKSRFNNNQQKSPSLPRNQLMTDQQRLRKIAMRKVKARLLKYEDNLDDSDDQPAQPPPITVKAAPHPQAIPQPKTGRKQSKWGKTSSSQPVVLQFHQPSGGTLSLQLQHSDDHLKLSEDKSIDIEQPMHDSTHLQPIDEQEIDELDLFMKEVEGQAVKQIDIQIGAPRAQNNSIKYEEVVTMNATDQGTQAELANDDYKNTFLNAIAKLQEVKKEEKNDERGTLMQLNEAKSEKSLSDFEEAPSNELDFFAKQRKLAQRKELPSIDHSTLTYPEVRFDLYRQADQVKNYNPKDIARYRKEAGDIKVRGRDVKNPVFSWYHLGLAEKVLAQIQRRQYAKPFPIQAQALPLILSGRDVIGIAQTGSGKTLAYLLPVLKHIKDQNPVQQGQGPISLIMTPTRQLCRQVYLQAKSFCKLIGIRCMSVHGGQNIQNQLAELRKGVELIVCTPGRMIDILTLNKGKITNLKRVTMLVLDEADRMFDLGFQPQITRILDTVRPKRQVVMFSATFPKNIEILARKILVKPVEIIVGSRGQACANVQQIVQVREETTKLWRLLQILGVWNQKGSILIFVDKQTQGDFLFQQLRKYGYASILLHGAMDPNDRQFAIHDFKKGVYTIMIATSVCARGLDIRSIVLVINFMCPNHLQDYIHRIGRTGRGGNKGTAITFITPGEQCYSIDLIKALEMAEIHPPEQLIKLSQNYLSKVKKGQARRIKNRNVEGKGYKFDQDEEERAAQVKDMLKKQMKSEGLGFSDSQDDDIEMKKKKQEDLRGRNQQDRIAQAIKNPQIKSKLLSQAVKAVTDAMKKGTAITTEKLLQIAVSSMKESVVKHKAMRTTDDQVQQVTKLINQYQNKNGGDNSDFFSYDFEINDYPQHAKQKACNQQFLRGIQHSTNCAISLRGVQVQPGKKLPVGSRKLYLHIQGQNKYYVQQAYKEIKRVLQENAYESLHMGIQPGKYLMNG